jgi:hypothetical protein
MAFRPQEHGQTCVRFFGDSKAAKGSSKFLQESKGWNISIPQYGEEVILDYLVLSFNNYI